MADLLNGKAVGRFILKDGSYYEVNSDVAAELERLCPDVDLPTTLREIELWCWGHTDERKTRRGAKRFLADWLKREQAKAN